MSSARRTLPLCALGILGLLLLNPDADAAVPPLVITTATLPAGLAGNAYSATLGASGGTPPYTWSVASGGLPGGVVLSSTGQLFGIPGSAGSSSVALRVNDSLGLLATRTLTVTIAAPPPPPQVLIGVDAAGTVQALGTQALAPVPLPGTASAVGVAGDPVTGGLWVLDANGQVLALNAPPLGSATARTLRGKAVAISSSPTGSGYLVLSSAGRVAGFGGLASRGRVSGLTRKVRPVALAVSDDGGGYAVALSDGAVDCFGDVADYGGVARRHLSGRVVGIAIPPGGGYVLASSTGHLYRFGPARDISLPAPRPPSAVAIARAPNGAGYFVVAASGAVYPAGSARPLGSLAALAPLVAAASLR